MKGDEARVRNFGFDIGDVVVFFKTVLTGEVERVLSTGKTGGGIGSFVIAASVNVDWSLDSILEVEIPESGHKS